MHISKHTSIIKNILIPLPKFTRSKETKNMNGKMIAQTFG